MTNGNSKMEIPQNYDSTIIYKRSSSIGNKIYNKGFLIYKEFFRPFFICILWEFFNRGKI